MTNIQDSWEVLCIVHMQLMWETLRLHVWLLDTCSKEQSQISRPLWGCTGCSVQAGRLETQSQGLAAHRRAQLASPTKLGMKAREGFHP